MAFIRTKVRGSRRYAYLVESQWQPGSATPRQRVLAYLGPEERVQATDVPSEYRATPAVARWLAARQVPRADEALVRQLRARLSAALPRGDREELGAIAHEALEGLPLTSFLEEVVTPVMRAVGERWHAGELSVAEEHAMTRAATDLVRRLRDAAPRAPTKDLNILLVNPEGEQHALALDVLECALARMGHRATVLAGGAPARDVAKRAQELRVGLALVSVTQPELVEEALALSRAIRGRCPRAIVALGGQAWGATRRELDARERLVGARSDALADLVREARELAA